MAEEFFSFSASGVTDMAAKLGTKLTDNGWVYMGEVGGVRFYKNSTGEIRTYITILPFSNTIYFGAYLYVDPSFSTSTPQATNSQNSIVFGDANQWVNVVGIVDDFTLTIFCDKNNFTLTKFVSMGVCDRTLVLPDRTNGWCKVTDASIAPGTPRTVNVDRDIRNNIRTGQNISLVRLGTGALVADHTTITGSTASSITLAAVTQTYNAGAEFILGLNPIPSFCAYGGILGDNPICQFVLSSNATVASATFNLKRGYEDPYTNFTVPAFPSTPVGFGPAYISRLVARDSGEAIMGILPRVAVTTKVFPIQKRMRLGTRSGSDPLDFWISPFGEVATTEGVPLLGPNSSKVWMQGHQGILYQRSASVNVSIS